MLVQHNIKGNNQTNQIFQHTDIHQLPISFFQLSQHFKKLSVVAAIHLLNRVRSMLVKDLR